MPNFLIDVPMPSMGATVNELTIVSLKIAAGSSVIKGQKVAELESDKSIFEFEAPCDGIVKAILAEAGAVRPAGTPFLRIETSDESLRHLEARRTEDGGRKAESSGQESGSSPQSSAARHLVWTPRASKMAQEAGLDPAKIADIEATGPGGRVSGDDVTKYLASRR